VKVIILAAGYATRLYPLTLNRAKALLPVGGRPILEHLLDRFATIDGIDGSYVVTNAKFAGSFEQWSTAYAPPQPGLRPTVVDDGTHDDETRLGAIGDLGFVLQREAIDDDLLVAAGDNLFEEPLDGLVRLGLDRRAPVLTVYDVGDLELVKRYSVVTAEPDGRVTHLEEKPERPESTLIGVALYFYPRGALPLVRRYLDEGNNPDQPGRLMEWLYTRAPVYAWRLPGRWIDIGSPETLREAELAASQS
jgi:glucose-1-phosphate thymidylyltransferase